MVHFPTKYLSKDISKTAMWGILENGANMHTHIYRIVIKKNLPDICAPIEDLFFIIINNYFAKVQIRHFQCLKVIYI